jgi:hypothetical protein
MEFEITMAAKLSSGKNCVFTSLDYVLFHSYWKSLKGKESLAHLSMVEVDFMLLKRLDPSENLIENVKCMGA